MLPPTACQLLDGCTEGPPTEGATPTPTAGAPSNELVAPTAPGLEAASPADVAYWELCLDPARDMVAHPDEVLALLPLEPGMKVADVGASSGYFTFPLARAVGPEGRVYATDLLMHGELRSHVEARRADRALNPHDNVTLLRNQPDDVRLPPGLVDLVFLNQVGLLLEDATQASDDPTRQLAHGQAMVRSLHEALAPGGHLVLIDLLEDPSRPFPAQASGFAFARDPDVVQQNYEALGFRLVATHPLYLDEAHRQALSAFEKHERYEALSTFLIGHPKLFMVFERVGDPQESQEPSQPEATPSSTCGLLVENVKTQAAALREDPTSVPPPAASSMDEQIFAALGKPDELAVDQHLALYDGLMITCEPGREVGDWLQLEDLRWDATAQRLPAALAQCDCQVNRPALLGWLWVAGQLWGGEEPATVQATED